MEWLEVKNNIYACLEVGSAETKIMVCNIRQERLYILAQATVKTQGVERGNVVNVTQAVEAIKSLKQKVERDLNQEIQQIYLAIPSIDINLDNVKSSISLRSNKPINTIEIKQLFRNIVNQPIYRDQVVVNIVPRAFIVDEKNVIQNPTGIIGKNLSLRAQKITTSASLVYNLINVVELSGFRIADIVLGSIAESMYVLTIEQLNEGTCLVNIGHSMTTVTVVSEGKVLKTVALSMGGQQVTDEIAKAFNLDLEIAEQLKVNFGAVNLIDTRGEIVYTQEQDDEFICVTRQALSDIVTARYEVILKGVKQFLTENGLKQEAVHYVFTGGGSEVRGFNEFSRLVIGHETTSVRPSMLGVRHGQFTTLIGAATYCHELSLLTGQKPNSLDCEQYLQVEPTHLSQSVEPLRQAQPTETKGSEKTFMDSKLENSGVLVRLFDMIFDEKEE